MRAQDATFLCEHLSSHLITCVMISLTPAWPGRQVWLYLYCTAAYEIVVGLIDWRLSKCEIGYLRQSSRDQSEGSPKVGAC